MSPDSREERFDAACFPRVSGDEPTARPKPLTAHVFSPREWG